MTCHELSDRMPAVARGESSWTPAEAEHLQRCADCRAEWEVVMAGAAVARDVSPDADAMAARVLKRLRTEPPQTAHHRVRWMVGIAAAAMVVLVLSRGTPPVPLPRGPAAPPLSVDVPGLDAVDAADLERVLDAVDTPWTETSTADAPSLDDLTDQELARVARGWEN
jgi:hypothetical protein